MSTTISTDTRHCNRCKEDKPLTEWTRAGVYCRPCMSAYNREYRARTAKPTTKPLTPAPLTTSTANGTRHRPKIDAHRPNDTPGGYASFNRGPLPKILSTPRTLTDADILKPAFSETEKDFLEDYWEWDDAQIGLHIGRGARQIAAARRHYFI